jgi:membrane protein
MFKKIKGYLSLLKDAGSEFVDDNGTKLAASLSYFTIFAIGPLLLVVITIAGVFFKRADVTGHIYSQMKGLVGADGARQLLNLLDNVNQQPHKTIYGIVGAVILVFSATGIFAEIQGSINYIWSIKTKPKRSWLKYITDRVLSFSLIVGIGFMLLITLVINTLMDLLTDRLQYFFGSSNVALFHVLNVAFLFVVITFMFAVIYKVLPDAVIHWHDAVIGAAFTGVLFIIGKFGIGYYLGSSNMTATFGTAASMILLLSWVYYSSNILYFGAEFTKVYALKCGRGIAAYDTAVFVVKNEAKELPNRVIPPEAVSNEVAPILNPDLKEK